MTGNGVPGGKVVLKNIQISRQVITRFGPGTLELITKLFNDEAPPNLYFNNSSLVKNISNNVELLSRAENLCEEDFINLKLAAVFLLTGFIYDYEKPMEASMRLVEEILTKYGFDRENIESARKVIKSSYSDHQESLSDNILHDARYDYLGRVDYIKLTDKLLRERTEYGKHSDNKT